MSRKHRVQIKELIQRRISRLCHPCDGPGADPVDQLADRTVESGSEQGRGGERAVPAPGMGVRAGPRPAGVAVARDQDMGERGRAGCDERTRGRVVGDVGRGVTVAPGVLMLMCARNASVVDPKALMCEPGKMGRGSGRATKARIPGRRLYSP